MGKREALKATKNTVECIVFEVDKLNIRLRFLSLRFIIRVEPAVDKLN